MCFFFRKFILRIFWNFIQKFLLKNLRVSKGNAHQMPLAIHPFFNKFNKDLGVELWGLQLA